MEFGDFLSNDEGSDNELTWDDGDDDDVSSEDDSSNEQSNQTGKKRKLKDENNKDRKKLRRERKVAPPTSEEMIHLRETETLFKSNLFRLEIEEMLKEIKPIKTFQNAAKTWIDSFRKYLKSLKEDEEWIHVSDTEWLNNIGVCLPLSDLKKEYDGVYKFLRPIDVKPVGTYNCDCTMGPKFNVDVAVIVPKAFYRKKDYLNQMYHYKRALYLCAIAGHLKQSNLIAENSNMKFVSANDNNLKPLLIVNPRGKAAGKVEMFIHVIPEEDTFQLKRFIPSNNNVRKTWWGIINQQEQKSTPQYNSSILEDMVMESNERLRKETFEENENMKEALCLLRVWLKQRNLDQGHGAFSTYIMSMLLIYLKDKQKINKHMSSYQVIRLLWLYLGQSNWDKEGISMCKAEDGSVPGIPLFHDNFDVVFIDPSGYLNLTARMNKLVYLKVKRESAQAIELLDATEINGFQALFMVKMSFINEHDHVLCFSSDEVIVKTVLRNAGIGDEVDYNGYATPIFNKLVADSLLRGLGERITELNIKLNEPVSWDVDSCRPIELAGVLAFGMKLHPENSLNVIDKGPEANLAEGVEFRQFWGEKCELRRFKDGTVCECMVWEENTPSLSKRFIINKKITSFLLEKLGIKSGDYTYIADQLDHIIETRYYDISAEEACLKIHKSLEELSRQLVELEDLPLEVTTVHCISPSYRYADVFPPLGCFKPNNSYFVPPLWTFTPVGCVLVDSIAKTPPLVPAIDLVLQMTFTRRWPDNLAACRRLTSAFYIAIANKLHQKHRLKFIPHTDCLIVQKDGLMFRLFLGYSKEISLLKLNITKDGVKQYRDTPESLELERKFINLPNITGALHGLSIAEPGFGGGARLVKRWLAAHMLDSYHFPQEVAELIVASLFLRPQPYKCLLQPQQIFLRFLSMMASTNWHTELLVVNFNNILTKEEIRDMERKFERERSSFPTIVIVTPYDKSGTLWTRKVPTLPTVVRLAKLASATLEILQMKLQIATPSDLFTDVFTPNLQLYDVIISLKAAMVPRKFEKVTYKQLKQKVGIDDLPLLTLPITDFDPPQLYLKYLRENYDEYALFFYDTYGGFNIGVLFKPITYESSEFKANSVGGKCPNYDAEPSCLKTNFKSLVSDFKEVGEGLVAAVKISERFQKLLNS